MRYLFLFCFCWLGVPLHLYAIEFVKPIIRLKAPVYLSDVVRVDKYESSRLDHILVPFELQGWITQQSIDDVLREHTPELVEPWTGRSRVWFEQCYQPNVVNFNQKVEKETSNFLRNKKLFLIEAEKISSTEIPCIQNRLASEDVVITDLELLNHNTIKGTVKLNMVNNETFSQKLIWRFDAEIEGVVLTEKAIRNSGLDTLKVSTKRVRWTNKELTLADMNSTYQLKKNLPRNTTLKLSHIRVISDVEVGNVLKVIVVNGPVEVTAIAKAVTAGNIGDNIKIKVQNSKTISQATIIAKGVVHVSV
jgi:hypothetical protein